MTLLYSTLLVHTEKRKIPYKSAIYKGFVVPRPAFEILNTGTSYLILLNLII